MSEIYIGKQAIDREELLYLFWNVSDFHEMREEMVAWVSSKYPSYSRQDCEEIVSKSVYKVACEEYPTLNVRSGDWLGLLRNNYFQKMFDGVRLQSNGKTRGQEAHEKYEEDKKKRKEKIKKWAIYYAIGFAIGVVVVIYQLITQS